FPQGPIRSVALVSKEDCYGSQAADIRGYLYALREKSHRATYKNVDVTADQQQVRAALSQWELPWFRLPISQKVLMDLRDSVILSRPKFQKLYRQLLSK